MTTQEAIQTLLPLLKDEILICTTGYVCRDVCAVRDRPQNFYMIGSMGLAPAIALGIAANRSREKVVVFDGDGALLMGLGILPMVGTLKPLNYLHVVFDNESYASTGHQRTYSRETPLEKLALACGYDRAEKISTDDQLKKVAGSFLSVQGIRFLLIKCTDAQVNEKKASSRIPHAPEEITNRLRHILGRSQ